MFELIETITIAITLSAICGGIIKLLLLLCK
jgi:hypothetical protein